MTEQTQGAGGWISVDEWLPDEHQIVDAYSIYAESRIPDVEYYDGGFHVAEQKFDTDDCGEGCFENTCRIMHVTHWQPLPAPPRGCDE